MNETGNASRATICDLLGIPDPSALGVVAAVRGGERLLGRVRCEGWTLTTGDVDPGIPCLLLTPPPEDRRPGAALAVHQHAGRFDLGKSEPAGLAGDATLAYGLRLAEAGIVTLIPDLVGFEDRRRAGDAGGDAAGEAAAENLDALVRVAAGDNLQAQHSRDVAALTSWLSERTRGPVRIIGHSLGGQVALFAMAVDPRIRAGVVSCGLGTLASFAEHGIHHNPAWFVPGLLAAGDVPMLARAVDQPVFVSAGLDDALFPFDGVRQVVAEFARVEFRTHPGGHELPPAVLDDAVGWLTAAF